MFKAVNATPINYSFSLVNTGSNSSFTPPNIQTYPISLGTTVSNGVPAVGAGNLEAAGAEDVYTFTVVSGQAIYLLDLGSSSSYLANYRILDPYGNQIANNWLNGGNNYEGALGAAGTHTITVNNNGGTSIGTYSFQLLTRVPSPVVFNIPLGQVVTNAAAPGAGAGTIPTPRRIGRILPLQQRMAQTIYLEDFWQLISIPGVLPDL